MNYYNRITEVLSADQILLESSEDQQRIDELFGRIGRAMGTLFSGTPSNPYTGQWNPLRGKYEGGLGRDERMAAIKARLAAKRAAGGGAGSPTTKVPPPPPLPPTAAAKPTPAPAAAPAQPQVTRQQRNAQNKAQAQANMAAAQQIAAKQQQRTQRDVGMGADLSTVGKAKGGMKALRAAQNQEGAGRFGKGGSVALQFRTKGGQGLQGAAAQSKLGAMKKQRTPSKPLPLPNSTFYGNVAKMIRESFQLNEKKDPCWKGYEAVGMKMKGGRKVPNCVPKSK